MRGHTKWLLSLLVIAQVVFIVLPAAQARGFRAKNIIFMVPDGMGLANVTAVRTFKCGPDGSLFFETLPQIGYQKTHAKDSTVTDSAAAASAWASGEKYNNGEISCHDDDFNGVCDSTPVPTVLEIAKRLGKATGLVVTSDITHATPAAFGAHVHNRKCEEEIARQYINVTGVEVLLGGSIAANRSSCRLSHSTGDWLDGLLADATAQGYALVNTEIGMNRAVEGGVDKILGLFKNGGKSPENFLVDSTIPYPESEPTLAEMTSAALAVLEKNRKGFFLLVEGSQIDWANHGNRFYPVDSSQNSQLGEMLAFDAAVEVVLDWINEMPARRASTLVIVVPDHETGGFAIDGPEGELARAGGIIQTGWTSTNHTAVDTLIWSQGPGSRALGKALDNTELYEVMKKVLK
jgi:alkaline phosphatase